MIAHPGEECFPVAEYRKNRGLRTDRRLRTGRGLGTRGAAKSWFQIVLFDYRTGIGVSAQGCEDPDTVPRRRYLG